MLPPVRFLLATAALSAGFAPALLAQTAPAASTPATTPDTTVKLNAFEVTSSQDYGYRKMSSVTTSRVGLSILEIPQSVEIISSEMLNDFGVVKADDAFRYSASVTANGGNEISQGGTFTLRGFELPRYFDGVQYSPQFGSGSGPSFSMDNIDRIEVAKGPVGLFYGNSTPNGVANYIIKKPEFINKTTVTAGIGSDGYYKALFDTQALISQKEGIAFRLISSYTSDKTRMSGNESDTTFVNPSLIIRPSDILQVTANASYTQYHQTYPRDNQWNWTINPLYYQDVANPSQQMLNYMKTKYSLADDTAARAMINSRWGSNQVLWSSWLTNWSADHWGAYGGKQPFAISGDHVDWWRFGTGGSTEAVQNDASNVDGNTLMEDVSATLSPWTGFSVKYTWLDMNPRNNFTRFLEFPNSGIRANGEVISMSTNAGLSDSRRDTYSDTQQLDLDQEFQVGPVKNSVTAGAELRRQGNKQGSATFDLTRIGSYTNSGDGMAVSGLTAAQYWDPFKNPYPINYGDESIAPALATVAPVAKYRDLYASYRGTTFNDRLHVLFGVRNVKQNTFSPTGFNPSGTTYTYGAIYEFAPGLDVFASHSSTFQFNNNYNVILASGGLLSGSHLINPESGKGTEAGLKSSWMHDMISGTLSYYTDERSGIAKGDTDANLTDPRNNDADPNNDVRFTVNGGNVRATGLDGDFSFTPTAQLQFILNLDYQWEAKTLSDPSINQALGETTDVQNAFELRLPKSPVFKSDVVVKYNFDGGLLKNFSVGGAARYTDDYRLTSSNLLNITIHASTMFDTFIDYRTRIMSIPTSFHLVWSDINNVRDDYVNLEGAQVRFSATLSF